MKTIEKVKKKLKFVKWVDKHSGTVILSVGLPLMFVGQVLSPIFPAVGLPCFITAILHMLSLGIINLKYADNKDLEILLEKQIKAMETVDEEKVETLSKTITYYENNPDKFIDKKSTKNLIKELTLIKKSAVKALKEKNSEEIVEQLKENDNLLV